jgi:Uma2 family endonuclease
MPGQPTASAGDGTNEPRAADRVPRLPVLLGGAGGPAPAPRLVLEVRVGSASARDQDAA